MACDTRATLNLSKERENVLKLKQVQLKFYPISTYWIDHVDIQLFDSLRLGIVCIHYFLLSSTHWFSNVRLHFRWKCPHSFASYNVELRFGCRIHGKFSLPTNTSDTQNQHSAHSLEKKFKKNYSREMKMPDGAPLTAKQKWKYLSRIAEIFDWMPSSLLMSIASFVSSKHKRQAIFLLFRERKIFVDSNAFIFHLNSIIIFWLFLWLQFCDRRFPPLSLTLPFLIRVFISKMSKHSWFCQCCRCMKMNLWMNEHFTLTEIEYFGAIFLTAKAVAFNNWILLRILLRETRN